MSEQPIANGELFQPREIVENLRAQFDSELEGAVVALELWNLRLQDAFAQCTPENAREIFLLAHEAKKDMDINWSYYGDSLMVSGRWDVTEAQETHTGIEYRILENRPVFGLAVSHGFEIDFRPGSAPQVGFSFKHSQASFANRYIHGRAELLSFARMGDVSLSLARKSERLETISPSEMLKTVQHYNDLLQLHTDAPSDFYQKPASEQQQFLHSIINDLSDRIFTPPYITICEDIDVPYLYRRLEQEHSSDNTIGLETVRKDEGLKFSGRLIGVTILDTLFPLEHTLSSKDDLLNPDAGICFIVTVSAHDTADSEPYQQDLLVPSRALKHVKLSIR